MTEANRLLDGGTERERALLRAGADERPSEEAMQAAAQVLGLVPKAAIVATVIGASAKGLKWSSLVGHVVVPGLVVVGALGALYATLGHRSGHGASTAPAVVTRAEPSRVSETVPAPATAPPAASASLPTATRDLRAPSAAVSANPSTPVAAPRGAAPASTPSDSADSLRRQVAFVDRARALLSSGDAAGALQTVDQYDRAYPRGVLSEEASLVRIEATAARGDRGAASSLANRFLAEHPSSVHAARVRALADGAN